MVSKSTKCVLYDKKHELTLEKFWLSDRKWIAPDKEYASLYQHIFKNQTKVSEKMHLVNNNSSRDQTSSAVALMLQNPGKYVFFGSKGQLETSIVTEFSPKDVKVMFLQSNEIIRHTMLHMLLRKGSPYAEALNLNIQRVTDAHLREVNRLRAGKAVDYYRKCLQYEFSKTDASDNNGDSDPGEVMLVVCVLLLIGYTVSTLVFIGELKTKFIENVAVNITKCYYCISRGVCYIVGYTRIRR